MHTPLSTRWPWTFAYLILHTKSKTTTLPRGQAERGAGEPLCTCQLTRIQHPLHAPHSVSLLHRKAGDHCRAPTTNQQCAKGLNIIPISPCPWSCDHTLVCVSDAENAFASPFDHTPVCVCVSPPVRVSSKLVCGTEGTTHSLKREPGLTSWKDDNDREKLCHQWTCI